MSTNAVGNTTTFVGTPKRLIACGTQHFTLDEAGGIPVAECHDCHRQIPFGMGTPWKVIDETMKTHRLKFCAARIEVGRGK